MLTREQYVARKVREQHGIELTPDQVKEQIDSALSKLRAALKKDGIEVPDDDEQFIREMAIMLNKSVEKRK